MTDLITRCRALLEGHEPEAWPVPISKSDLRELLVKYIGELPTDWYGEVYRREFTPLDHLDV